MKLQVIGLMLLGLAEAVIDLGPLSYYRKRDEVGGSFDFQAANVLAETVEVIDLPLIFSSLSRSNICCIRVPVAPSRPLWKLSWNIRK